MQPSRLTREQEVIKRAEDVIVSFLLLVPALPVMLLIALGIKLEDRGPVFYRQKRVTKGGREFDMLKFRSMHVDAEKDGPRLAGKYDSRITKVGRVIRNLHFDELPFSNAQYLFLTAHSFLFPSYHYSFSNHTKGKIPFYHFDTITIYS